MRLLTLIAVFFGAAASAQAQQPDPVDRSVPPAPDGTPVCAKWVHDRHAVNANGRFHATWHPPKDPTYRCAFGHEHGSNPRAFRFQARAGMPLFGPIGEAAGVAEPHTAFKVFVVNNDRRGLAWRIVLNQGSSAPRRGTERFHSLELKMYRLRGRRLVADVRRMADFGPSVPNCPGQQAPLSAKFLPHPSCAPSFEQWRTQLDVGGVVLGNPTFTIDDPMTQFDPANPQAVIPNKPDVCGPGGWDSACKGDRRAVLHPRWVVRNTGPARFATDVHGAPSPAGPFQQYVSSSIRVDQRRRCCGIETTFVVEHTTDGGLYRAGRTGKSVKLEQGYSVLGPN